jgi:hypothetical protein
MGQVRNAGHLDFDGNRDLAFDLLGAAPRPLRDDLDVVVGNVGIGLNGQSAEREDAPNSEQQNSAKDEPPALEREIDESTNQ